MVRMIRVIYFNIYIEMMVIFFTVYLSFLQIEKWVGPFILYQERDESVQFQWVLWFDLVTEFL